MSLITQLLAYSRHFKSVLMLLMKVLIIFKKYFELIVVCTCIFCVFIITIFCAHKLS